MVISKRECIDIRQVPERGITRVRWVRMIGDVIYLFEAGSDFTGDWVMVTRPAADGGYETRTFDHVYC